VELGVAAAVVVLIMFLVDLLQTKKEEIMLNTLISQTR
jgi:hypothetical protein